ncbi:mitotic recombination and DNA repair protein rad59 [Cyanidiococcus yangmingshanensis]|uniref:Mitotic recombination and DNA repair protein rad59 n=1 Tax=Cyanidiococcus yangmingshanensis TaxID=2690220 RepID=A0A7J7IJP9_9RHOD|nr:mitotic recombination and DNA repair protein rad59 [Cyanidiococcus yangmingshanensis]
MLWASGLTPVAPEKEHHASVVSSDLVKASPWRTPPLKRSREALEQLRAAQSPPSASTAVARPQPETASRLNEAIPSREVSKRVGPGGKALYYLQGWQAIQVANEIFGYGGWSNALQSFQIDYCEQSVDGRWNAMATAVMRVTLLETGAFHDDVGCGVCDGMRTRGDALQKVKKEACTDAMKRALKNFGRRLGLMLYDKEFLAMLARGAVGGSMLNGTRVGGQAVASMRIPAIPSRLSGGASKTSHSKSERIGHTTVPAGPDVETTYAAQRDAQTDTLHGGVAMAAAAASSNPSKVPSTPTTEAPTAKNVTLAGCVDTSWSSLARQELDSLLQQFELDDEC